MKTTLNNNIQKAYIKNIKKQLKISSKYKRTLLNDLEINIDSYISEHPNTTYKDLVENFGTPEDVSAHHYYCHRSWFNMRFFFYSLLSKSKQRFTILHHWENWRILGNKR